MHACIGYIFLEAYEVFAPSDEALELLIKQVEASVAELNSDRSLDPWRPDQSSLESRSPVESSREPWSLENFFGDETLTRKLLLGRLYMKKYILRHWLKKTFVTCSFLQLLASITFLKKKAKHFCFISHFMYEKTLGFTVFSTCLGSNVTFF